MYTFLFCSFFDSPRARAHISRLLAELAEELVLAEDQVLDVVKLDRGGAVLGEHDGVADGNVHGDELTGLRRGASVIRHLSASAAYVGAGTGADGDDLTLERLAGVLLRDQDTTSRLLLDAAALASRATSSNILPMRTLAASKRLMRTRSRNGRKRAT